MTQPVRPFPYHRRDVQQKVAVSLVFAPPTAPAPSAPSAPAGVAKSNPDGDYVVKKGDTLFSIAKSRYGNGNQYTKIVAANPGLSPQSLKAGQTISIP